LLKQSLIYLIISFFYEEYINNFMSSELVIGTTGVDPGCPQMYFAYTYLTKGAQICPEKRHLKHAVVDAVK
jgi:hypothetical protein